MEESVRLVRQEEQAQPTTVESFETFVLENHARLYGALCLLTEDLVVGRSPVDPVRPRRSSQISHIYSIPAGGGNATQLTDGDVVKVP